MTPRLSFTFDGSYLRTDRKGLELSGTSILDGKWVTDSSYLFIEQQWITLGTQRLLWLPSDYRATCWAVYENMIVVGHASARVSLIKFNLSSMSELL